MLAMVPPAFEKDPLLSRDVRGALTALSQRSEPWDGPAALVFSDGQFVGAKLDRNGLRPMRYTLTHDGLLIAGSETGLVDLDESRIAERTRQRHSLFQVHFERQHMCFAQRGERRARHLRESRLSPTRPHCAPRRPQR